jgi:hypothetical protein
MNTVVNVKTIGDSKKSLGIKKIKSEKVKKYQNNIEVKTVEKFRPKK